MARQLRITCPGAFYHVYSRGNQKQAINFSGEDRYFFMKLPRDARERHEAIWHLFCLMDSHCHLALETPRGNLSQIMHFVNSTCSIHLNTKYGRCGHLFQGRFRAILVQADLHARTLAKYIHGNPVRKGIVERPEQYEWSSCQDYYGLRKPPSWLHTKIIIDCFGGSAITLRKEHEGCLREPGDRSDEQKLVKSSRIGILGDDDFIDKIRRSYLREQLETMDGDLFELKRLRTRPELYLIKEEVHRELGEKNKLGKKFTVFLAHKYADYKLREIGEFFDISPTAVAVALRKTGREVASNETLHRSIELVRSRLFSRGGDLRTKFKS